MTKFYPMTRTQNHSFINLVTRLDHQASSLLNHVEGISHRLAVFHAHEGTILSRGNFATVGAVLVKEVAHHPDATSSINKIGFKANQPAHRNKRFDADLLPVMMDVNNLSFAAREVLHDRAHRIFWNFAKKLLDWFEEIALFVSVENNFGTRNENFVALPPHLFDQDGDLHFTTSTHFKDVRRVGVGYAEGDVGTNLFQQTLADVARGDELALLPGQRSVVDGKLHFDCRRINRHKWERLTIHRVGDRFPNENVLKAGHADDVAGMGLRNLDSLEAFEVKDGGDFGSASAAIAMNASGRVGELYFAADDFAEGDSTEVIRIIEIGHQHLELNSGVSARRRDLLDDGLEERRHGVALVL